MPKIDSLASTVRQLNSSHLQLRLYLRQMAPERWSLHDILGWPHGQGNAQHSLRTLQVLQQARWLLGVEQGLHSPLDPRAFFPQPRFFPPASQLEKSKAGAEINIFASDHPSQWHMARKASLGIYLSSHSVNPFMKAQASHQRPRGCGQRLGGQTRRSLEVSKASSHIVQWKSMKRIETSLYDSLANTENLCVNSSLLGICHYLEVQISSFFGHHKTSGWATTDLHWSVITFKRPCLLQGRER